MWESGKTLKDIEKEAIKAALKHFSGNRTWTAEELGISVRTMRNKIHEHKLYEFIDSISIDRYYRKYY